MKQVVERNRVETAPSCYHSHDFCDANMVLYEVFLRHGMDPATAEGMERHGALWDQAWNLAKLRENFASSAEAAPRQPHCRGEDMKA